MEIGRISGSNCFNHSYFNFTTVCIHISIYLFYKENQSAKTLGKEYEKTAPGQTDTPNKKTVIGMGG